MQPTVLELLLCFSLGSVGSSTSDCTVEMTGGERVGACEVPEKTTTSFHGTTDNLGACRRHATKMPAPDDVKRPLLSVPVLSRHRPNCAV